MNSKSALFESGIRSLSSEVVAVKDWRAQQDVYVDRALVVKEGDIVNIQGGMTVAGTILTPSWPFRKYMEFDLPITAVVGGNFAYVPVAVSGFIWSINVVLQGAIGANGCNILMGGLDGGAWHWASTPITIPGGSAAGDVVTTNLNLNDADDATAAFCGYPDAKGFLVLLGASNSISIHVCLELEKGRS